MHKLKYYSAISTLSLMALTSCNKGKEKPINNITPTITQTIITPTEEIHISTDEEELINIIDSNNNLSSDIKNKLEENLKIIIDNIEYINKDELFKKLRDLKFVINESEDYYLKVDDNVVNIYGYNTVEECFKYNYTSANEILASLISFNSETILYKAIKEIIIDEYSNNRYTISTGEYVLEKHIVYSLLELIGVKPIKEYFFTGDINIIINELNKILKDNSNTNKFLEIIENLSESFDRYILITNDYRASLILIYNNFNDIYNLYYEKKYEIKSKDDPLMFLYMASEYKNSYSLTQIINEYDNELSEYEIVDYEIAMPTYFNTTESNTDTAIFSATVYEISSDEFKSYEIEIEKNKNKEKVRK